MTDKERRTFTIDPENDELCKEHDNASALVNELLEQYRKGSDKETVGIDLQIEQKQRELRDRRKEVKRIERDIEELEQLRAGINKQEDVELSKAKEALANTPKEPTNDAIQSWASDLGLTPAQLIDELGDEQ